jgi:hypothetical protein
MSQDTLSVEDAAKGLKIMPIDILKWVSEGKMKAIKFDDTYRIPVEEYQRYGKTMPEELRIKIGEYLWKSQMNIMPSIQKDVNEHFSRNSQYVLDRDIKAVSILERIHKKYELSFDIFEDKRGSVAAFIIYARVISLLYSIIALLRGGIPAESFILYRPLWEAILLSEYFYLSEVNNQNVKNIRKWFEKDITPSAGEIRYYLAEKLDLPLEKLQELNHSYSKPIHHTYNSIMESYRRVSMSGFLGEHRQRLGFDYHQSTMMRDIITLISSFENILLSALHGFLICFSYICTEEEIQTLKNEIDFFSQDSIIRLDKIFSEDVQK